MVVGTLADVVGADVVAAYVVGTTGTFVGQLQFADDELSCRAELFALKLDDKLPLFDKLPLLDILAPFHRALASLLSPLSMSFTID